MYAIGRIQFFLVLTTYLTTWQYVAEAGLPCVSDAECVAMSYTDISPYEGVSNDEGAKCGDGLWRFETHKSCQLSCSTDQFCIDKLGSCPAPQCTWDCVQGRCEMSNLATVAPCALGDCSSNSDCCAGTAGYSRCLTAGVAASNKCIMGGAALGSGDALRCRADGDCRGFMSENSLTDYENKNFICTGAWRYHEPYDNMCALQCTSDLDCSNFWDALKTLNIDDDGFLDKDKTYNNDNNKWICGGMGATDPSGLGGLRPAYGYCKLKKDGKEPYDDHSLTASCESNLDCREWDNTDCPRYCEPNTKRCLKSCEYTCDVGSGSLQCGAQFKSLKRHIQNLNEKGLGNFLTDNPSRLVCLNNMYRYDQWEEMGDFGSPEEYYRTKWLRFHVGVCHVSCSSDNDCTAFADILYGVGKGSGFRTCRFDSDGVGACGNPCKSDGEFCTPGNRNGVECCSGKCGSDGKCFTPKPLCATSSECPGFLGTLAANQSALLLFKDASQFDCDEGKDSYGAAMTGENACLLKCTDQSTCATFGKVADRGTAWTCNSGGHCAQPCKSRNDCGIGDSCDNSEDCTGGVHLCDNGICRKRCDPGNIDGSCTEGEVCGNNLACAEKHCKLFDHVDQLAARSFKNLGTCEKLICTAKGETCGYDGECCGGVCSGARYSKSGQKFVKQKSDQRWIDPFEPGYADNAAFESDLKEPNSMDTNWFSGTDTVKNTQNWGGKTNLNSQVSDHEQRNIRIQTWTVERANTGWGIGRQSGYLKIKKGEAATYQFFLVANDVARFQLSTRTNGQVKIFCKVDADSNQKNSKLWVGRHMGEAWLSHGIYYYELVAINKNDGSDQCAKEGDKTCSCAYQGCPMDRLNYKYGSLPFDQHHQAKVLWKTKDDAMANPHSNSALRYIMQGWPADRNDPNDNSFGLDKHTDVATTDGSHNHEPGTHLESEAGFMVFVSYEQLGIENFDDTNPAKINPAPTAPTDPANELRKRKFSKFIRVDFFIKNDHSATRKYKFGLTIPKHMNAKIMVDSTEHLTANRMYTDGTNNDFDGTRHFFASSTFEIGPDSEKDIAFKAVYIVDNEDRDAADDVDKIDVVPWLAHVEHGTQEQDSHLLFRRGQIEKNLPHALIPRANSAIDIMKNEELGKNVWEHHFGQGLVCRQNCIQDINHFTGYINDGNKDYLIILKGFIKPNFTGNKKIRILGAYNILTFNFTDGTGGEHTITADGNNGNAAGDAQSDLISFVTDTKYQFELYYHINGDANGRGAEATLFEIQIGSGATWNRVPEHIFGVDRYDPPLGKLRGEKSFKRVPKHEKWITEDYGDQLSILKPLWVVENGTCVESLTTIDENGKYQTKSDEQILLPSLPDLTVKLTTGQQYAHEETCLRNATVNAECKDIAIASQHVRNRLRLNATFSESSKVVTIDGQNVSVFSEETGDDLSVTIAAHQWIWSNVTLYKDDSVGCNDGNYEDDDNTKYEVEGDKCVCKNGGKCNMLNHQDPERTRVPIDHSNLVFCINEDYGLPDSVPNPECPTGSNWDNCVASKAYRYNRETEERQNVNGVPNVYGYNLLYGTPKRMEGAVRTIKIKACGDGARHCPGCRDKHVRSPMMILSYKFSPKSDICVDGDATKCHLGACKRGGVFNNPFDTVDEIPGNDCTLLGNAGKASEEACVQNSECASKSCRNLLYTINNGYPIGTNLSLINTSQVCTSDGNCTDNGNILARCGEAQMNTDGTSVRYCAAPFLNYTDEYKISCESPAKISERYRETPHASVYDSVARKMTPSCTSPKLLVLNVESSAAVNNRSESIATLWPKFHPDFSGPYYASIDGESDFVLYARSSFDGATVEFTSTPSSAGSTGLISMGERSHVIQGPGGTLGAVSISVVVRSHRTAEAVHPSRTYLVYVGGAPGGIQNEPFEFFDLNKMANMIADVHTHDPDSSFKVYGRPMKSMALTNLQGHSKIDKIRMKWTDNSILSNVRYFVTLKDSLDRSIPLPPLANSEWRPVDHNQPVNIPMESCAEHVILVQSHGVLLLAYHVNQTEDAVQFSDSATGMIATNAIGSSTKVTLNDAYAGQFCSPGHALEHAFQTSLLAGTDKLRIVLHPFNNGDGRYHYKLSKTLGVMGTPAVREHVQSILPGTGGTMLITFIQFHQLNDGANVRVLVPKFSEIKNTIVAATVINDRTIQVKYPSFQVSERGNNAFGGNSMIICYTEKDKATVPKIGAVVKQAEASAEGTVISIQGQCIVVSLNTGSKPFQTFQKQLSLIGGDDGFIHEEGTAAECAPLDDCVYGSFKCYKIDSAKFNALNLRDVVHQIPNEEKLQSKPLKIASNANRRSISIEAGVTGKFVNGELKLEQHEHSCAQQDAILYRSADGHAICNPYDPQYNCNYGDAESNKYKIEVEQDCDAQNVCELITLKDPMVALYGAGEVKSSLSGVVTSEAHRIEIARPTMETSMLPVITSVGPINTTNLITDALVPGERPVRNSDGIVENDIDATYMNSYNLRLMQVYHSQATLRVENIEFRGGGVSNNLVEYDPTLTGKITDGVAATVASSSSPTRLTQDPENAGENAGSGSKYAYGVQSEFCFNRIQNIARGVQNGMKNGGAIFFAGVSFHCVGCVFQDNRVTGNGGAIFLEPYQSGRRLEDPDSDLYAPSATYATTVSVEDYPIQSTSFVCNSCIFRRNSAVSLARGMGENEGRAHGLLTGGYGGAIAFTLGPRYKVKKEALSLTKSFSVMSAYGSHGKLVGTVSDSRFEDNFAWRKGGAIFARGGKTVTKRSTMSISIANQSHFSGNVALQNLGGAVAYTKGDHNGDLRCEENDICDMNMFGMSMVDVSFGENIGGMNANTNDVSGDLSMSDNGDAWRDVANFGQECGKECCEDKTTCTGASAVCKVYDMEESFPNTEKSYACNDGVYFQNTQIEHLCTIDAKSVTKCPKGFHYGKMPGSCLPCEPGRYQPAATFDTEKEKNECIICEAGLYSVGSSGDGSRLALECKVCAAGQYQNEREQPQCKLCGEVVPRSYTDMVGASDSAACVCEAGFYDSRKNSSDSTILVDRCLPCPVEADCTKAGSTLFSMISRPGQWRPLQNDPTFFTCMDVIFPGADKTKSVYCPGGNFSHQCSVGRDKNVPLCDFCKAGYIENQETSLCEPCSVQEESGVDLNALMYSLVTLMIVIGFFVSLSYLMKAAMMFDMLDDDDSGYIELEELIDAVRTYSKLSPEKLSDKRIQRIFKAFCANGTPGVPKSIFKAMWLHTLAAAKSQKEDKFLLKRSVRSLRKANKHEPNSKHRRHRDMHIRALMEQNNSADAGATEIVTSSLQGEHDAGSGISAIGDSAEATGEIEVDALDEMPDLGAVSGGGGDGAKGEDHHFHLPPIPHVPAIGSTMKIIFSWGQILSSFNLTFDIPWPKTFDTVMTALYAPFNIDIFFFFENFKCQVNTNYSAAFYAHMSVPMIILGVIMLATVTAGIIKLLDCCGKFLFDRKTLKARVFKLINFFVFVMYPGLGLRIFRVFATQTYGDRTFLRADLSIDVASEDYKQMRGTAWAYMFAYVFMIPATYVAILFFNRRTIAMDPDDEDGIVPQEFHSEVIAVRTSFGSIYGDFKRQYYYFEIFEMSRKITLVGVLVLLGNTAGTQIFVGVIICFLYVLLSALTKPLIRPHDQLLQYITSVQLFFTLITGLLLRNRSFEKAQGIGSDEDDIVIDVLLCLMTAIIFLCIICVMFFVLSGVCPCCRCCCSKKKQRRMKKKVVAKESMKKVHPIVPEQK